jgi:8-oxo-dGTP pyrophosphatase MutT (NUDIX family)
LNNYFKKSVYVSETFKVSETSALETNQLLMEDTTHLISLLRCIPKYKMVSDAIALNTDYYAALPFETIHALSKPLIIKLIEGLGAQSQAADLDLQFHPYLQNVITPMVEAFKKAHPNHAFEDRKFRLHDFYFENKPFSEIFILSLAPTAYQQFKTDSNRSKQAAIALMLKGMQKAQDPYHYFAKILGLTVIVISKEGYVFLGERAAHIDYPNALNFVGGSATFKADLLQTDFLLDVKAELEEEIGFSVSDEQMDFQWIGIAGNPFTSELDLVFVVQSEKDKSFFENSILTEHQRMVCIQNKEQAIHLLTTGYFVGESQFKTLLYPTRFGLDYLVKYHW